MERFWSARRSWENCRYGCCFKKKTAFCHWFLRQGWCRNGELCKFAHACPPWLQDKDSNWWAKERTIKPNCKRQAAESSSQGPMQCKTAPESQTTSSSSQGPISPLLKRTLAGAEESIRFCKKVKAEEHSETSIEDLYAVACEGIPEEETMPKKMPCKKSPQQELRKGDVDTPAAMFWA